MHAADLLKGTGMVEARDVSGRKTDLIEENIMRCGFRNIRTNVWDATVLDPSMVEQADVVLADLPCSGLGIIGKDVYKRQVITARWISSSWTERRSLRLFMREKPRKSS